MHKSFQGIEKAKMYAFNPLEPSGDIKIEDRRDHRGLFYKSTDGGQSNKKKRRELNDERMMEKIVRFWTPKFEYVVTAIEELKDLSAISIKEYMGSLQAHEHQNLYSREKLE